MCEIIKKSIYPTFHHKPIKRSFQI